MLAGYIRDVKGMLEAMPNYPVGGVKVGHVDTTNVWTNTSNSEVIKASDFVGTDIYPYFQKTQNNSIANAKNLFDGGLEQVKKAVGKAGREGKTTVWVTETGWPVNGEKKNLAETGRDEAEAYWGDVACEAFGSVNTWWFTLQDWSAVPSFAVVGQDGGMLFDMSC